MTLYLKRLLPTTVVDSFNLGTVMTIERAVARTIGARLSEIEWLKATCAGAVTTTKLIHHLSFYQALNLHPTH